ncbi:MAG: hypothetical protein N7Q72_06685, partial [Spiroplasma sp. Tabriz.8]|nr:hypothetical protein [Spiroplasma sp. Tabriz.8]
MLAISNFIFLVNYKILLSIPLTLFNFSLSLSLSLSLYIYIYIFFPFLMYIMEACIFNFSVIQWNI